MVLRWSKMLPRPCVPLLLLGLAACGPRQDAPAPPQAAAAASGETAGHSVAAIDGIEWFQGDLAAAFAASAAQHKPVFLYWGAEWCPPCHDLKAHVFSRRDFQEKLRQFIPVYLDGDAPGAQRAAGDFQVMGYPTAVVLRADRTEVARIAGGMDLGRYADVLDLALENVSPLPAVLAGLRDDAGRTLSARDCRRLAFNAWALDPVASADQAALSGSLRLASQRCPSESVEERDRLLVAAAGLAAGVARPAIEKGAAPDERLRELVGAVQALLSDPQRRERAADALLDLDEDFFFVAGRLTPGRRATLAAEWQSVMDAIESNARYADSVRLMSAAGRLVAAKALDPAGRIPESVATRARATLDEYLARPYGPDARSGIVNSASWVLDLLEDHARLRTLLEGEMRASKTPYYYMADLAVLDEKQGRTTEALAWLERAYRESRGPATRFQWGVLYVDGLLRMAPQDEARIRDAVIAVIGELDGPDRIHARARLRVERMREALRGWSQGAGHGAALTAIAQRWAGICAALPASDPASRDCPALLAVAGA